MMIDRHNYEEYFLLYIDNELTAEQRKQVEAFIMNNPDLEQEFNQFRKATLVPDPSIVYDNKVSLLKHINTGPVQANNYEEWLVLYVDDELNPEEKRWVEQFVTGHPALQPELDLLRQTKLQPEAIIFSNKEILYRKERAAVIAFGWRRIAAAIFILLAGTGIYLVVHNRKEIPASTSVSVSKNPVKPVTIPPAIKADVTTRQQDLVVDTRPKVATPKVGTTVKNKTTTNSDQTNIQKQNESETVYTEPLKEPELIKTENNTIVTIQTSEPGKNSVAVDGNNLHKDIINASVVTNGPDEPPIRKDFASNENKRLRGFFRKATRFIEHRTNFNPANDDNRVLIGGMAINLK